MTSLQDLTSLYGNFYSKTITSQFTVILTDVFRLFSFLCVHRYRNFLSIVLSQHGEFFVKHLFRVNKLAYD